MKNGKRAVSFILAVVLLCTSFAGCGMEYRYTMDTPVSCRITDKAAMQTIFDALCEVKIGERTDMRATDSEQSLTFVKTDGTTCVIRFEQRNLLYEEDAYQLENDAALWKALREAK